MQPEKPSTTYNSTTMKTKIEWRTFQAFITAEKARSMLIQ